MLLPQFTIRQLLGLTAIAAVVSLVLQQAVAGALWAQCAGWTLVFIGLLFAAYAALFLLTWGVGQATGAMRPHYTAVDNPFAAQAVTATVITADTVPVDPFSRPNDQSPPPPSSA
jgi:hypothetical protein